MSWRSLIAPLIVGWLATPVSAVIIDQIAVRVDNSIIKDSDISRNVRVTDFLNDRPLDTSLKARKEAVKRLIDQVFIREEIRIGDYPRAEWSEADEQLKKLKVEPGRTNRSFTQRLTSYGITEPDLRFEFHWQLTVLRFIDARFRPAVLVSDKEIADYYQQHKAELRQKDGTTPALEDVQDRIREAITGEKVNTEFFSWLDGKRKSSKVVFYEGNLQ